MCMDDFSPTHKLVVRLEGRRSVQLVPACEAVVEKATRALSRLPAKSHEVSIWRVFWVG
jgi:hypothetical protein